MLKVFWKNFGVKGILPLIVLLASLIIIVTIHVAAFYGYLKIAEKNRILYRINTLDHISLETKILEHMDINKLIPLINLINQKKSDNHFVSVSETPQYPLHILNQPTYSELNRLIPEYIRTVQFSIGMKNSKWLNYQIQLAPMYSKTMLMLLASQILQVIIMFSLIWYVWRFNHFSPLLDNFRQTAERLGIVPNVTSSKMRGFSQVQAIANIMNQLQQRILDLVDRRNQLLASISHDLKTPITRLHLQLSLIKDQVYAKEMEGELDEMNALLNQLISFSKADPISEKKINLDLISLLQTLCDKTTSTDHNVNFHTSLDRAVFLGRPLSLKRAFNNIINNGIKYGVNVNIYLEKKANDHIITFDDDGAGIDAEEMSKVFQPFYRGKKTAHFKQGSGLGLTIAQEAIQAHQGKIDLTNRPEDGFRVTIFLTNAVN